MRPDRCLAACAGSPSPCSTLRDGAAAPCSSAYLINPEVLFSYDAHPWRRVQVLYCARSGHDRIGRLRQLDSGDLEFGHQYHRPDDTRRTSPPVPACGWRSSSGGTAADSVAGTTASPRRSTIDWSNFIGGPQIVQALEANAIDVGLLGDVPLAYTQVAKKGIVAIVAFKASGAASGIVSAPGEHFHPLRT